MQTPEHHAPREEFNPFRAPEAAVKGGTNDAEPTVVSDAEAARRKHLNHETSVRAIGLLNYLSGGILVLCGLIMTGTALSRVAFTGGGQDPAKHMEMVGAGLALLAIGTLLILLGKGLRGLRTWARITQGVLSLLAALASLVGFNLIGILFHGFLAYVTLSEKGQLVCSADYRRVVAATPHIRYRLHWVTKVLLASLLGLVGLGAVIGILSALVSR